MFWHRRSIRAVIIGVPVAMAIAMLVVAAGLVLAMPSVQGQAVPGDAPVVMYQAGIPPTAGVAVHSRHLHGSHSAGIAAETVVPARRTRTGGAVTDPVPARIRR
jgi:hypothetical protein